MYKQIIEPILQLDKLECLTQNKVGFEIMLWPKDLKNLSKRDEIARQRVHLQADGSIFADLSPTFERHSK